MPTLINQGKIKMSVQDHVSSSMNDSGTDEKIDTPLTQWRSPTVRWPMIYFIRADSAIKIGYSVNPEMRLGELQVGAQHDLELLGVMHGEREDEGKLHKQFANLRIRGEWFRAERVLLDFIEVAAEAIEPRPEPAHAPPPPPAVRRDPISAEAKATIANLINLRDAHGANTPVGYRCSNLAELLQIPKPPAHLVQRQMNDLARLRAELQ